MSDGTYKKIIDLNINDKLLTLNDNYDVIETFVTHKKTLYVDRIININNGLLKSSESHIHLIKYNDELIKVQAMFIKENDILIDMNGNEILIESVLVEDVKQEVVDISTHDNTYIANNILTHNKNFCLQQ